MTPTAHKLWLTRRPGGYYLLTAFEPVIADVKGCGGVQDAYARPGEPIGVNYLCPNGTRLMFGLPLDGLPILIPTRVELYARVVA
jgi:hypothetical protein